MPHSIKSSVSGVSGLGSSTFAAQEPAAAVSPATLVVRDRNLAKLISDHASPGTRSMPVGTRWRLDEAREAAIWRGIHPNFVKHHAAYADQALAQLEHGQLKPEALLTEFTLRLARARLPAKYPESEGKRAELARQMAEGMATHIKNRPANFEIQTSIALLLDAAYGTPPSPAPTENTEGDPEWAKAIVQADTLRHCLHTFLSHLAGGIHDLKKLEKLARQCARLTDEKRSVWYGKLAFFAAQSGAWRTVKLLLDAKKLRPDKLGQSYWKDCYRIYVRVHSRDRAVLLDAVRPWKEDRVGLLHLAAAQNETDMLACLHGHLTAAGVSIDYWDDAEQSALFYAAIHDNARAGAWLIANQANIDARSVGRNTPLHYAATYSPAVVRLLIEARIKAQADLGQYVNATNDKGESPLAFAGPPASVTLLCKAGAAVASISVSTLEQWIDPSDKSSDIHLLAALHDAWTAPDQRERFRQLLNPAQKQSPLVSYLRYSFPLSGPVVSDGPACLREVDKLIATVRLFLRCGADPHCGNNQHRSAHDLARAYAPDTFRTHLKHLSDAEANAPAFRAELNTRLDTLRQLLGWPAAETAEATQTGKRKREDGE